MIGSVDAPMIGTGDGFDTSTAVGSDGNLLTPTGNKQLHADKTQPGSGPQKVTGNENHWMSLKDPHGTNFGQHPVSFRAQTTGTPGVKTAGTQGRCANIDVPAPRSI